MGHASQATRCPEQTAGMVRAVTAIGIAWTCTQIRRALKGAHGEVQCGGVLNICIGSADGCCTAERLTEHRLRCRKSNAVLGWEGAYVDDIRFDRSGVELVSKRERHDGPRLEAIPRAVPGTRALLDRASSCREALRTTKCLRGSSWEASTRSRRWELSKCGLRVAALAASHASVSIALAAWDRRPGARNAG
jgi:hypothetical protein